MNKKIYQLSLLALLIIVITAMYFQFRYFGSDKYWISVIVLLGVWLASKWLQKQQEK
jgi:hypothetical protein